MLKWIFRGLVYLEPYGVVAGLSAGGLGMAGVVLAKGSAFVRDVPLSWASLIFLLSFGLMMGIYNVDRWKDNASDFDTPERVAAWDLNSATVFLLTGFPFAVSAGVITLASSPPTRIYSLGLFAFLSLLGVFYSFSLLNRLPGVPARIQFRAKDIPYVKSLYVSAVWGATMLFPAVLTAEFNLTAGAAFAFFVFLRMIPACNAGDIRDIHSDSLAGRRTFPTVFGSELTIRAMKYLHILAAVWLFLAVSQRWLPFFGTALLTNCIFGFVVWTLHQRALIDIQRVLILTVLDVFSIFFVILAGWYAFPMLFF
ncbi:hypothetical protein GlitD10_0424 [Gloeomargarita lithophora Alchichica-D10]|uniref:UbiA prenyltransferase n=1 Tax=Gloeomargarita lithophora Alchichica-D10 TaxID=1188229 RepID=A0A1J0A9Y3_9CYAN|nr:UbiA family prenyltransferase [Gloeomargarita lithophora]APB32735.1 hypothetical protein GlitD10_0424 [Gloeomargarita lithophora Alchichica-D10]